MFRRMCFERILSELLSFILLVSLVFISFPLCLEVCAENNVQNEYIAEITPKSDAETVGLRVFGGNNIELNKVYEYGKEAWKLDPSNGTSNQYIYVDVDDSVLYNLTDGRNVEVEVEYFDDTEATLTFEYVKYDWKNITTQKPQRTKQFNTADVKELEHLQFTNTHNWKTYTWNMSRASLNNGLNGADFRLAIHSSTLNKSKGTVLVHSIKVRDTRTCDTVDINIKSEHLGNIFYTGESMDFNVEIDNSVSGHYAETLGEVPAEITYTLLDGSYHMVDEISHSANIKPLQIYKDSVTFHPTKYDTYTIQVKLKAKGSNISSFIERDCSYVRSSKGAIVNRKAGISFPTQLSNYMGEELDLPDQLAKIVNYAGYDIVRINQTPVQTAMSTYQHFTPNEIATHIVFADSIKALKDNGVKVMMYCTEFNRTNPQHQYSLWYEDGGLILPYTERGRQRLLMNELAVLREHEGNVDVWEIGNEANAAPNYTPTTDSFATQEAEIDKLVYPAIKSEFQDLFVGTVQYAYSNVNPWFTNYFEAGGMINQDFISIHPYLTKGDPITNNPTDKNNKTDTQVNIVELNETFKKYGFNGELWATEYGCSTGWQVTPRDDMIQAAYNTSWYLHMTKDNLVDKMVLFRLDDKYGGTDYSIENTFGIIKSLEESYENRGAAKPGYLAEANKNLMMYDAEYVSDFKPNENTIGYRYYKKDSKQDMFAVFTNKELDIMSVDLGINEVTLTDMYGNETQLVSDDGVFTFSVTKEPFYCSGNFKKFNIVDSSGAYPMQTQISAVLEDNVCVDFVNNTDEKLEVLFEADGRSEVEVPQQFTASPGISTAQLKCGANALKDFERVKVSIKGNKGTKFSGYIVLHYGDIVRLNSELKYEDNQWILYNTLENKSDSTEVNGKLTLIYPYDLGDQVAPIEVSSAPGSNDVYKLVLPNTIAEGTSITVTTAIVNNDGTNMVYSTNRLDFIYASKAKSIKIDGELSEWDNAWMCLNSAEQFEQISGYMLDYKGQNDLQAKVALKWDEENLYFAAEVHDDVFYATDVTPVNIWQVDAFQLAMLYDPEGRIKETEKNTFEEIAFCYLDNTPTVYRHKTMLSKRENPSTVENCEIAIVKNDNIMNYEVKFPWASLLPEDYKRPTTGTNIKFALLLNDNDGMGRKGYYKLGDGIANGKDSSKFLNIFLAD